MSADILTLPNKTGTVLRDIREAMRAVPLNSQKSRDHAKYERLQDFAEHEFASINGWTINEKGFPPEDIGRRRATTFHNQNRLFDHCIYFRGDGKCAALVAQPYSGVSKATNEAFAIARELGLTCHVAPHLTASIYYPGWTLFIVFTMPGHVMRWLPEQINGIQI
jgi:hypothetical protein